MDPKSRQRFDMRLTDLPIGLIGRILQHLIPDFLYPTQRLLCFSCSHRGLHRRPRLPWQLVNIWQVSRTVRSALTYALEHRAYHVDNYDIAQYPFLWLNICAPVLRSFTASEKCTCASHYWHAKERFFLRAFSCISFPKLKRLDVASFRNYKSEALERDVFYPLLIQTTALLQNISSSIETLIIPNHFVFSVAFKRVSLPFLSTLEIHPLSVPSKTLGYMKVADMLQSLAGAVTTPPLRELNVKGVDGYWEIADNQDLRLLLSSITTLYLMLPPGDNTSRAKMRAVKFASAFPGLRHLEWHGAANSAHILRIFASCARLERFVMGIVPGSVRCQNLQQQTPDGNSYKMRQMEAICEAVGRDRVLIDMNFRTPIAVPMAIEMKLPLRQAFLSSEREGLVNVYNLCLSNRVTLEHLYIQYNLGERNGPDQHGNMTCHSWSTLEKAVCCLGRLSTLQVIGPSKSKCGGSINDMIDCLIECMMSMGCRARTISVHMPCEQHAGPEQLMEAHARSMRVLRMNTPYLHQLHIGMGAGNKHFSGWRLPEGSALCAIKLLAAEVEETSRRVVGLSTVGEAGQFAAHYRSRLQRKG